MSAGRKKGGGELEGRVWERWIWNECNLAKICKERSHTDTPTYTHTHSDIKHWSDKRNEKRLCKLILRCTNNNNYGNSYRSNESNCVCDNTERKVKEYIYTKILVYKKLLSPKSIIINQSIVIKLYFFGNKLSISMLCNAYLIRSVRLFAVGMLTFKLVFLNRTNFFPVPSRTSQRARWIANNNKNYAGHAHNSNIYMRMGLI